VAYLSQPDLTDEVPEAWDHLARWLPMAPAGQGIRGATRLPALNWPHDLFAKAVADGLAAKIPVARKASAKALSP